MGCTTCHNGYAAKQMPSTTIDIGFAANSVNVPGFSGSVASGAFTGSNSLTGYTWSAGSGTTITTAANSTGICSVYCHGSTLTGGTVSSPSWTGGASQAACGACHGATSATPPTTGSHTRHAIIVAGQLTLGCDQCHGAHTDNSHITGSFKWDLTLTGGQYKTPAGTTYTTTGATTGLAPSAAYGTCSVSTCHGSGTPVWGGTLWSTTDQCG
jgi:predicted CxxxxCH...CXXCH cytochrome family protein